ncbi:hypothetical protein GCM10010994_28070 [Chelatococcus reniformis]|uniref:Uncharacterized protein n=1 Tax=Chelatococcus reniformis TaxID=1494448 RepID=A0A916UCF2_9HYPH|nr:hypothetical protein GCM10010994_28070 [Chelatococcus reniformis]
MLSETMAGLRPIIDERWSRVSMSAGVGGAVHAICCEIALGIRGSTAPAHAGTSPATAPTAKNTERFMDACASPRDG